ncbi:MAG TPA: hypothetical protein VG712_07320, partial [Gemmatimonadales bacterium]|nr:hypothetical protein [Gemmatimonadales bacterium]
MRLTIGLLLLTACHSAQRPDTLPRSVRLPVSDSALRLPTDRPSDLLPWLPGGGLTADGAPSWHGSTAEGFDRVTDGIRWASGFRSRGFSGRGAGPVFLEPGFAGLADGRIDVLGGGPATLRYRTRSGGDHWTASGSGESEAPFRAEGGMGISRFEAGVGGPLGGTFRLRAAMELTGREGISGGIGYGDDPYYVPTGIDTVMRYADLSSLPDSIDALVQSFGPTTKVPFTARSRAGWTLRTDGAIGPVAVWGRWIGARTSERLFNYVDVANPLQARGENTVGHDIAVGASGALGRSGRIEVALSLQRERAEQGPLTTQAQFDSRDPGLGLMLGGLDLRWTMDNFPIDAELLDNYRTNTPGSRRTPYDLENTAQYALVDRDRNNPYGVLGWSESGGPTGVLAFFEDHRLVVTTGLTWALPSGRLRLASEVVRHDAKYYSHALTSQAFSDVWLEKPTEASFQAEWSGSGPGWHAALGSRVHRFATGAVRPYLLDTDPSSPTYGKYQYFPRISSYGSGIDSLRHDVEDQAHTAIAPYALIEGRIREGWTAHALAARSARMPELTTLLAGVNTDLAIT